MLLTFKNCEDCPFMEMSTNCFRGMSMLFATCKLSKRKLADGTKLPEIEIKNLRNPPKECPFKNAPNSIEVTCVE